ncbi:helix-turn-helix domain-containing protein [Nocardioides sp.]|uniref:helix-turn-helix domain-containing protein n=1 Tax=Nocardioides sp. TaxID=35761 RepID=UPI0039C944F8
MSLARIRHGKPHHYWADTREAADLLGVTIKRVHQLIRKEFLPAVQAPYGRWYFRRAQLEVVTNARNARHGEKDLGFVEMPHQAARRGFVVMARRPSAHSPVESLNDQSAMQLRTPIPGRGTQAASIRRTRSRPPCQQ